MAESYHPRPVDALELRLSTRLSIPHSEIRIPQSFPIPPALRLQKLIADFQLARAGPLPVEMA